MNLCAPLWIRWTATPFAAIAGYALGCIAWRAAEGVLNFLSFVPFLPMLLWIGPLISTYWSALWSLSFAVRCAPSNHMNVRWSVLVVFVLLLLFELAAAIGVPPKQQGMQWLSFVESAGVIGWLFVETWREHMTDLRENLDGENTKSKQHGNRHSKVRF